jgi:hypothetical protein
MEDDHQNRRRWLEIEDAKVQCPLRQRAMPLHECAGCARFLSLALDPKGEHVYIDCNWDQPDEPLPAFDIP